MQPIQIGILGYGNLGRGVELALQHTEDMVLAGIFTRRDPSGVKPVDSAVPVHHADKLEEMEGQLDVLILCGGSAKDLPVQTPAYAKKFHVVDSFDTHANIPEHFSRVDEAAKTSGHVGVISIGWDPGLFSLNRLMLEAILPQGTGYTFWGKGVSQGHSDAIRRIEGVQDARQYTIPVESALEAVRSGKTPHLTTREKHRRECFVVVREGADKDRITKEIQTMPKYFDEYDTTVQFITQEELDAHHQGIPHGGQVIHTGKTGANGEHTQVAEFSLKLDSNPEFTASVLVAYARAAYRLAQEKQYGAKTIFDIAPGYLSPKSPEELRASLL